MDIWTQIWGAWMVASFTGLGSVCYFSTREMRMERRLRESTTFCKDCRWFDKGTIDSGYERCTSPKNGTDGVSGEVIRIRCSTARVKAAGCGPAARWFIDKDMPVSLSEFRHRKASA